jgi:hypothetical protein
VALAEHVAGSVRRFVREMNEEAAVLGLSCTQYSTPSGYVDQGNFSCPADLAELAYDDLAQPRIARIAGTVSVVLPFPIKGGKLFLYNNNPIRLSGCKRPEDRLHDGGRHLPCRDGRARRGAPRRRVAELACSGHAGAAAARRRVRGDLSPAPRTRTADTRRCLTMSAGVEPRGVRVR